MGNRERSERRGFIIPLRRDLHPNGAYFEPTSENRAIDLKLKAMAQEYYEEHYGSRDDFRMEFGKSYL